MKSIEAIGRSCAISLLLALTAFPVLADRQESVRGDRDRLQGDRRFDGRYIQDRRHSDERRLDGRHDNDRSKKRLDGRRALDRHWHGDIRHFNQHDFPRWRAGQWRHGVHDGRMGWWWVVGGLWYFYPQPVFPYPNAYIPPTVIIEQVIPPSLPIAQQQYWYYCEASASYYPYVPTCPSGWKMVPAVPPELPR